MKGEKIFYGVKVRRLRKSKFRLEILPSAVFALCAVFALWFHGLFVPGYGGKFDGDYRQRAAGR